MAAAPATWNEFRGDLRQSLRAWRVAPLLPVASVLIYLATFLPTSWIWLAFPVILAALGWLGTERIWYLRIFRGESATAKELWRFTWAYFWRFARLGLLAAILWAPALIFFFWNVEDDPAQAKEALSSPAAWIVTLVSTVAIDFILTFVTPALAFTTKRVRYALRLGLRMLREHWPHTAWYALIPPLAVSVMFRVTDPSSLGLGGRIGVSVGSTLVNLWFKGATAAFYLRRVEVDRDGAAFTEEGEPPRRQRTKNRIEVPGFVDRDGWPR